MKNHWKSYLGAALCLTLSASLAAGCSSGSNSSPSSASSSSQAAAPSSAASSEAPASSSPASSSAPANSEPVTITALLAVGTMPPEENIVLDAIREKSGVNLVVTLASQADYANKKATLAASHNLPDLIRYTGRTELKEMASNDVIVPLDDLLQNYGQELAANKAGMMEGNKIDGVLYAVPRGGTEALVPRIMAVRKDWLDTLGLEVPETVEDFYTVMKAFTENDPNKNGTKDTIGFGMGPNNMRSGIFQAFGISVNYETIVEAADVQAALEAVGVDAGIISQLTECAVDGKLVVPDILNPHYPDAVAYFQRLYQEGLMETDFATIPWMQCLEKMWNGNYGAFSFSPVGTTNNWLGRYVEDPLPEFTYTVLKSEFSDGGVDVAQISNSGICINASCENPEEAMSLLNFMCSAEGNDLTILGIEGKHYKDNGDGTVSYLPPYDKDLGQQRMEGGFTYNGLMDRVDGAILKTFNKITSDAIDMGMKHQLPTAAKLVDTPEILNETGSILTDMKTEAFSSLVVTNNDLSAEYKSYVEKFCRSGGIDWVRQAVAIYYAG